MTISIADDIRGVNRDVAAKKHTASVGSMSPSADVPGAPIGELPRLGYLLKTAQLRFITATSVALSSLGIDTRQWATLACIEDERHLSQVEMAELLGIDRTTMVALLDALEGKRLVSRQPHPEDRRKNEIVLTAAGHNALVEGGKRLDACESEFLSGLDPSEAYNLKRALVAIIARPSLDGGLPRERPVQG